MGIPLSSFLCHFSHAASKEQCCLPGCENNFDSAKASEIVPKLPKLWDREKNWKTLPVVLD